MKIEPNEPEFPCANIADWLTKREYFAGLAMQAQISTGSNDFSIAHVDYIAEIAVANADALIKALNDK